MIQRDITIGCTITLATGGGYYAKVKGYPAEGWGRTADRALDDAVSHLDEFFSGVASGHVSVKAEVLSARAEMMVTVEDTRQLTLDLGETIEIARGLVE